MMMYLFYRYYPSIDRSSAYAKVPAADGMASSRERFSVSLKNYKVKGDELLAMQEAANDVLAHLYEDKNFKSK